MHLNRLSSDISNEYATLMFEVNGAMTVAAILTILINVTYGLNTTFAIDLSPMQLHLIICCNKNKDKTGVKKLFVIVLFFSALFLMVVGKPADNVKYIR